MEVQPACAEAQHTARTGQPPALGCAPVTATVGRSSCSAARPAYRVSCVHVRACSQELLHRRRVAVAGCHHQVGRLRARWHVMPSARPHQREEHAEHETGATREGPMSAAPDAHPPPASCKRLEARSRWRGFFGEGHFFLFWSQAVAPFQAVVPFPRTGFFQLQAQFWE